MKDYVDKSNGLVKDFQGTYDKVITERMGAVTNKCNEFIRTAEMYQDRAKDRYESFFKRKTWLDNLVILNLMIMPTVFAILVYYQVFSRQVKP